MDECGSRREQIDDSIVEFDPKTDTLFMDAVSFEAAAAPYKHTAQGCPFARVCALRSYVRYPYVRIAHQQPPKTEAGVTPRPDRFM